MKRIVTIFIAVFISTIALCGSSSAQSRALAASTDNILTEISTDYYSSNLHLCSPMQGQSTQTPRRLLSNSKSCKINSSISAHATHNTSIYKSAIYNHHCHSPHALSLVFELRNIRI